MKSPSDEFVNRLTESVRANPIAATLIGMGALWLLSGRHSASFERLTEMSRDGLRSSAGAIRDAGRVMGDMTDTAKSMSRDALDASADVGSEYATAASRVIKSAPDSGRELLSDLQSQLTGMFERQPLVLGAVGLALGAGVAAAFPSTSLEAEYLGATSDEAKAAVAGFAEEQTERLKTRTADISEAVSKAAAEQGLSVEAMKSTVGDVVQKIGNIAGVAGETLSKGRPI